MRITIDIDDKGKVNIDTGDKPGLFGSTTDIPVIDAGPAPIEQVERLSNVITATEGDSVSTTPSPQAPEAQMPLNPLRAGAAAAYQRADNLRTLAADYTGTSAAQDPSIATIDGGPPRISGKTKAAAKSPRPAKAAKRDKKR